MIPRIRLSWLIVLAGFVWAAQGPLSAFAADLAGALTIAGNGPEQVVVEKLARTFEKANSRVYIDVQWDQVSKPIELVKTDRAQVAVTGKTVAGLKATQIAWDGIAVMVNVANQTKEVSTQDVADIFTGKVRMWSDLGGPDTKILLLDRPAHRNIRDAFEQYLGIEGKIPADAKVVGPDDKAIKTVTGTLPPLSAVTYISLGSALEAVASGVAVRLLPIDKVEPEEPPVKDGRYKLRRPVLFLSKDTPNPVLDAFVVFVLSPEGQQIVDEVYTPLDQKK